MFFLSYWQPTLIVVAWGYALFGMLFVLATERELLAKSSRDLFVKFPDIAVALGVVIGVAPDYAAGAVTKHVLMFLLI
jgi:hypothetical protein